MDAYFIAYFSFWPPFSLARRGTYPTLVYIDGDVYHISKHSKHLDLIPNFLVLTPTTDCVGIWKVKGGCTALGRIFRNILCLGDLQEAARGQFGWGSEKNFDRGRPTYLPTSGTGLPARYPLGIRTGILKLGIYLGIFHELEAKLKRTGRSL